MVPWLNSTAGCGGRVSFPNLQGSNGLTLPETELTPVAMFSFRRRRSATSPLWPRRQWSRSIETVLKNTSPRGMDG